MVALTNNSVTKVVANSRGPSPRNEFTARRVTFLSLGDDASTSGFDIEPELFRSIIQHFIRAVCQTLQQPAGSAGSVDLTTANILYGKHGQSTVRSFAAVCKEWYVAIQQHFFTFLRFTHEEVARHIENRTLPLNDVLAFIDIRYSLDYKNNANTKLPITTKITIMHHERSLFMNDLRKLCKRNLNQLPFPGDHYMLLTGADDNEDKLRLPSLTNFAKYIGIHESLIIECQSSLNEHSTDEQVSSGRNELIEFILTQTSWSMCLDFANQSYQAYCEHYKSTIDSWLIAQGEDPLKFQHDAQPASADYPLINATLSSSIKLFIYIPRKLIHQTIHYTLTSKTVNDGHELFSLPLYYSPISQHHWDPVWLGTFFTNYTTDHAKEIVSYITENCNINFLTHQGGRGDDQSFVWLRMCTDEATIKQMSLPLLKSTKELLEIVWSTTKWDLRFRFLYYEQFSRHLDIQNRAQTSSKSEPKAGTKMGRPKRNPRKNQTIVTFH